MRFVDPIDRLVDHHVDCRDAAAHMDYHSAVAAAVVDIVVDHKPVVVVLLGADHRASGHTGVTAAVVDTVHRVAVVVVAAAVEADID